jgi:hypothetical protein
MLASAWPAAAFIEMIELLIELFGEFVLQVFGEALLELGLHSLAAPFQRKPNIWLASIGYAMFGAMAGGLSLVVFPHHFAPAGILRTANLFATPIAVGVCMVGIGAWRGKRQEPVLLINRFLYGFIFASGVALVRFHFAD